MSPFPHSILMLTKKEQKIPLLMASGHHPKRIRLLRLPHFPYSHPGACIYPKPKCIPAAEMFSRKPKYSKPKPVPRNLPNNKATIMRPCRAASHGSNTFPLAVSIGQYLGGCVRGPVSNITKFWKLTPQWNAESFFFSVFKFSEELNMWKLAIYIAPSTYSDRRAKVKFSMRGTATG